MQNLCRGHPLYSVILYVLAKLCIVIDRMYMKGYTDAWCKCSCVPKPFPQLNHVSTQP